MTASPVPTINQPACLLQWAEGNMPPACRSHGGTLRRVPYIWDPWQTFVLHMASFSEYDSNQLCIVSNTFFLQFKTSLPMNTVLVTWKIHYLSCTDLKLQWMFYLSACSCSRNNGHHEVAAVAVYRDFRCPKCYWKMLYYFLLCIWLGGNLYRHLRCTVCWNTALSSPGHHQALH